MNDRHKALIAFKVAVQSYVPTQNKRAWHSDGTDKISQLLLDAKNLELLNEQDVCELTGKSELDIRDWFNGDVVPKSKIRYKLRREILLRIERSF